MNPFMPFDRLGDVAESAYKKIYTGDGAAFGSCVERILYVLDRLVNADMITNTTRKRIKTFLAREMSLPDIQVISSHTNHVVLLNTETHEQDSFDLREYITWITEALCKDSIMKRNLHGRENYEGVKRVLNDYGDDRQKILSSDTWIDFYICDEVIFFTKKDEENIHLYIQKREKDVSTFLRERNALKDALLMEEALADGRIYHFDNDESVFVEDIQGGIIKIEDVKDDICDYSYMQGNILNQLADGSLLILEGSRLICLNKTGIKKVVVDNEFIGVTSIEGNEIYWKSRFRRKDVERGNNVDIEKVTRKKMLRCLKKDKVSKEMLWKGLLLTLYDFDRMNFDEHIGNRIKFACFFDRLPMPFTLSRIMDRLSEVEAYCYDGDIIKGDEYIEAMGYLMDIDIDQYDENATTTALIYLLENVTINPYERIASCSGHEVLDCVEFFFGDTDEENNQGSYDGEDKDYPMLDITDDEFMKLLDKKIAELDKQIEKEKRKERESKKLAEQRRSKETDRVSETSDKGRSAEIIRMPFGD